MQAGRAGAAHPRALVIDDEELVREVLSLTLQQAGFTVCEAASGEEALAALEPDPAATDVVILDLTLPGMSGAATLHRMRACRADLPILLVSGVDRDTAMNEVATGTRDDALAFLEKPCRPSELQAAVEALLGRSNPV